MSTEKPKGTRVWISACLSFIAALGTFNAVMLLTLNGGGSTIELAILDLKLGFMNVSVYFILSTVATLVLLGLTFFFLFRGPPSDPRMLKRLSNMENAQSVTTSMLENMQMGFFRRLEDGEKATDESLKQMRIGLEEGRKETIEALEMQKKALDDVQKENKKTSDVVKKQTTEVTGVKKRVGKIEKVLLPAKTKLTCKSRLEQLKGMKPRLADGLKTMGITNVGQFLTTDPAAIAEKTMELHETVASLQGQAQLLMVPGIDQDEAELLVKAGVTSRKELAAQDPVQLSRDIVNVASTYVEGGKMSAKNVPSIDEVWMWIRSARA